MATTNLLARIAIPGQVIAKKNSRPVGRRGGRTYVGTSAAHRRWEAVALGALCAWRGTGPRPVFEAARPISVQIDLWRRDRRHYDPDNMGASVLDALVKAGIIPRDGFPTVHWVLFRHAGIDADNPRADVTIYDGDDGPTYDGLASARESV